jgi:hypothetical protein
MVTPAARSKYDPGRTPMPLGDRFWSKVRKSSEPDGCWEWMAARWKRAGGVLSYGNFQTGSRRDGTNRPNYAHRVSWEMAYGPIPDGMNVLHKCDNVACVRPDHLFLGSHEINMKDMARKNRNVPRAKLTPIQVLEIRRRYAPALGNGPSLAREYGISHGNLYAIVNERTWRSLGS